jgi:hypothetical protein
MSEIHELLFLELMTDDCDGGKCGKELRQFKGMHCACESGKKIFKFGGQGGPI